MANYNSPWQISALGSGTLAASQNTISLGGLNGAQGAGWSGSTLNLDEYTLRPDVKKYEVYEISVDLLALSVCWARYRKVRNNPGVHPTITKLLDSELFRLVSEEDIAHANTIRDYYSKKIMVWKLKNISFTSFRNDMNEFIHSTGKTFKESMIPLVYRLPEFYDYDVEFEQMSFDYNKEVIQHEGTFSANKKRLKFVKKLNVNRRSYKVVEYWFQDEHNNLVTLPITTDNPLLSLLDFTVDKNEYVNIDGIFRMNKRGGDTEYLKIHKNFKFV